MANNEGSVIKVINLYISIYFCGFNQYLTMFGRFFAAELVGAFLFYRSTIKLPNKSKSTVGFICAVNELKIAF